jgi:hypothetical protein
VYRICSCILICFCLAVVNADAAGVGRAIAHGAARSLTRSAERSAARSAGRAAERQAARRAVQIQRKDLWNHQHTPVRPLPAPRTVHRYVSPSQAKKETRTGIAPGSHMTARAPAGRPPNPGTAASRYGLRRTPGVRETIELPKGFPVRHNKVPGGRPGAGEITSSRRVPSSAIKKETPLR